MRTACASHRSQECGSSLVASGPTTAVESEYTNVNVATAGLLHPGRQHFRSILTIVDPIALAAPACRTHRMSHGPGRSARACAHREGLAGSLVDMMRGPFGDRAASARGLGRQRHTGAAGVSRASAPGRGGTGVRGRVPSSRSVERRGRGPRGSILPAGVPARLSRSAAFDQLALSAFSAIDAEWHDRLTKMDLAVDDVPRISARNPRSVVWPPEVVADGAVPLARLIPAGLTRDGRPTRARLVLFRRPLELRARKPEELMLLIHDVLVEQVANYLGVTPEIIDPTLRED